MQPIQICRLRERPWGSARPRRGLIRRGYRTLPRLKIRSIFCAGLADAQVYSGERLNGSAPAVYDKEATICRTVKLNPGRP